MSRLDDECELPHEPWQSVEAEEFVEPALRRDVGNVRIAMLIDADGDYRLGFNIGIVGSSRTLPEIEAFADRVAALINAEPVVPD